MISKANTIDRIEFRKNEDVLVYQASERAIKQPDTFQLCELGLQFYAISPLPECRLLDLEFVLPLQESEEAAETIQCTGVVVQCMESNNGTDLYRVWVKFIDLPDVTAKRIREFTVSRHLTCPFCANF